MADQIPIPTDKVVMTQRDNTPPAKNLVLKTPAGEANVEVIAMSMWEQAFIRALRTYLQSLVGFLLAVGTGAAGAVGVNLPVGDFGHLMVSCASLAVAPAAISLLHNVIEILAKLDSSAPEMRA